MKVCKVSDYETAFNFLVAWLMETSDVVEEKMPDPNDEVECAKADGYMTCCHTAIVLAEYLRNKAMKAMKAERNKND